MRKWIMRVTPPCCVLLVGGTFPLSSGCSGKAARRSDGNTALLAAAEEGHLPVVQWLLGEGGLRIEETDSDCNTALLWAANEGHLPVIQWLLREGGSSLTETSYDGSNVWNRLGWPTLLQLILSRSFTSCCFAVSPLRWRRRSEPTPGWHG